LVLGEKLSEKRGNGLPEGVEVGYNSGETAALEKILKNRREQIRSFANLWRCTEFPGLRRERP